MHNCLILGSGRSGTSMIGGLLAKAGYFMGDDLLPANNSNPKGFFEDVTVNAINEQILEPLSFKATHPFARWFTDYPLTYGQHWLARVPVGIKIPSPQSAIDKIKEVTLRTPFCFKDPRFSYTLSVWRPHLVNTVFLCVFRDPATTAASINKECGDDERLHSIKMNFDNAVDVWTLMYRHILEIHRHQGEWLFMHYDQVLSGDVFDRLEEFIGTNVDRSFPEKKLRRSSSARHVPRKSQQVYAQLCELAGYR